MTKKSCVLDASVLLYDPDIFQHLPSAAIYIPAVVLEELDQKKRFSDVNGKSARHVMRFLDGLSRLGDLKKGVDLENGSHVQILFDPETKRKKDLTFSSAGGDRGRHRLLNAALRLKEVDEKVKLISHDYTVRIMAETLGIKTHVHKGTKDTYENLYKGISYLNLPKETVDTFYQQGYLDLPDQNFFPNEYCVIKSEENSSAVCRVSVKEKKLLPLNNLPSDLWSVKHRNVEQRCALDLLMDDDVKLVTLTGNAGTGKTLLSLATALRKVFDDGIYQRIMITRSVIPMGKDIGFLPGNKEEKMFSWVASFYDNLDYICASGGDSGAETKKWILESEKFQVEALTYLRGRSIANTFFIIDEAQNLSPHEIKTIISRAGENTKIVLMGDPTQIDNAFLDRDNNGLVYLIGQMKRYQLTGSIHFKHTERSELAALAAEVL